MDIINNISIPPQKGKTKTIPESKQPHSSCFSWEQRSVGPHKANSIPPEIYTLMEVEESG